jgi:hypothetical protein
MASARADRPKTARTNGKTKSMFVMPAPMSHPVIGFHDLAEFSCKGSATVIGALLEPVLTGDDRSFSVTLINIG